MSASRDMHITLPQDVADWLYAQAHAYQTKANAEAVERLTRIVRREIHAATVFQCMEQSQGCGGIESDSRGRA